MPSLTKRQIQMVQQSCNCDGQEPGECWDDEAEILILCSVCGGRDDLVADHIISLNYGGQHCEKNQQTLCRKCNSAKGDRVWPPFQQRIDHECTRNERRFRQLMQQCWVDGDSQGVVLNLANWAGELERRAALLRQAADNVAELMPESPPVKRVKLLIDGDDDDDC